MRVAIFRRGHFNAAHRLHVDKWSDVKNKEVFGKCNNANYHGHNYEVMLKVAGEVDPETGMLMNLTDLKNILKVHVEDRFDHKNLNLDCPEFENLATTVEHLCYVIWTILRKQIDEKYDISVKIYETRRNHAQYPAKG